MATQNITITAETAHQLKGVLSEIATLACSVSEMAAGLVLEGKLSRVNDAVSIELMAKTIGWMADFGTSKLGGGDGFKGPRAEDWMLNPLLHSNA